jgi:hypothetical protein
MRTVNWVPKTYNQMIIHFALRAQAPGSGFALAAPTNFPHSQPFAEVAPQYEGIHAFFPDHG